MVVEIAAVTADLIGKMKPTDILLLGEQKMLHRPDIRANSVIYILFALLDHTHRNFLAVNVESDILVH
jgi:hypothetical protein